MYGPARLFTSYLRYYLTASDGKGHGMHSPFVFEFIRKVMNDKKVYPEYAAIETLRKQLFKDATTLHVEDLGAGSAHSKIKTRTVSSLASTAAKPKKYGQLLFRIARHYNARCIVELGTSLGMSTAYLASSDTNAEVLTIEGSKEIAEVAKRNFATLGLQNIRLLEGNFDDVLTNALDSLPMVDMAFIDGNHRKTPTLDYFEQLLPKMHNDSILVFDDIHWSSEMEEAWQVIRAHPQVKCTVDLFFIGIVFLRREFKEKRHFTLRF